MNYDRIKLFSGIRDSITRISSSVDIARQITVDRMHPSLIKKSGKAKWDLLMKQYDYPFRTLGWKGAESHFIDSIATLVASKFGSSKKKISHQQRYDLIREILFAELPKDVDAKGYPDTRYYGYSIGHWDGDYTFVIGTTGLDERAWLDEQGHVKSKNAHIEERYTRLDQYTIQLTATLDDPKFYTKPWMFLKANYYWMKAQDFQEVFCVPSEGIEYRETLALPAGTGDGAAK